MAAAPAEHWVVRVARHAELDRVDTLNILADVPIDEAWEEVGRVCAITEDELAGHVATFFKYEVANFETSQRRALKLVPEAMARRYQLFPLRENDRNLVVSTADPTNLDVEQTLGFASGRRLVFEVAPPGALRRAIEAEYSSDQALDNLLESVGADMTHAVEVVEELTPDEIGAVEAEQTPVIKLTNVVIRDAIRAGASDIHIEPGPAGATVRYRVDGVMRHHMRMPMVAANRVVSRIKVLGKLDIADRLRPQDGRVRIEVDSRAYDLRISTVPTQEAEKCVIRILDPKGSRHLDEIGMSEQELARMRQLLSYREGIVVVTGPTGSGKTTTLYAGLSELANGKVNIMTVEDPVEYRLAGITQIQVETAQGLTFASALRAILRQDPDVILVGEIRDRETAEVAAQASMTGHLVLATLHTNDAVGVVARLTDLGLDAATIAATLRGSVAQRLARRLCEYCKKPDDAGPPGRAKAEGCRRCEMAGYKARLPINEVLVSTPDLAEVIARKGTAAELERVAVAGGMRALREVAHDWVDQGVTDDAEIGRVLGDFGEVPTGGTPSAPHILVVDDDAENRLLARMLLEGAEFQVSEAVDGQAAVSALQNGVDYSLILLDLSMPKMDGREVLARVRGNVKTAGLPVVVFTASDNPETEVQLMDEGADDYLHKPIDPTRLIARVRAALRRAGS